MAGSIIDTVRYQPEPATDRTRAGQHRRWYLNGRGEPEEMRTVKRG